MRTGISFLTFVLCVSSAAQSPPEMRPLLRADARTKSLVEKVAGAYGGANVLGGVRSVYDVVRAVEISGGRRSESQVASLYVYPGRAWTRIEGGGAATLVVTPHQSWITGKSIPDGAAMRMPDDLRRELLHRLDLDPLFLLAHRQLARVTFAAGEPKSSGGPVGEVLHVRSNEAESVWTIDPDDGRILQNAIGPLTMQYSDWRTVRGLTVPFRVDVADRKDGSRRTLTLESFDFNLAFDERALFDPPRVWFDPELDLSKTFDRFQYMRALYANYYSSYYYNYRRYDYDYRP